MSNTANNKDLEFTLSRLKKQNERFLNRFFKLNVQGLTMLDFGSGMGGLSFELVQRGAKYVVGVDLNMRRMQFARKALEEVYPEMKSHVRFVHGRLDQVSEEEAFDAIISKATVEHLFDIPSVLDEFARLLKPGGSVLLGFGPLYHSPWGDHFRMRRNHIPWSHLFLPEKYWFRQIHRRRGAVIRNKKDLGLNGLSFSAYQHIFYNHPKFWVQDFRTNVSDQSYNFIFKFFSKIPLLKKYFIHNIYCELIRKP